MTSCVRAVILTYLAAVPFILSAAVFAVEAKELKLAQEEENCPKYNLFSKEDECYKNCQYNAGKAICDVYQCDGNNDVQRISSCVIDDTKNLNQCTQMGELASVNFDLLNLVFPQ